MPAKYPAQWHRGTVVMKHLVRAELALGRRLPAGAEVHHADGTTSPDAPLVICPDRKYHHLLRVRARVLALGGDPNTQRICHYCGLQPIEAFAPNKRKVSGVHCVCRACHRHHGRVSRAIRKSQQVRRYERYSPSDIAVMRDSSLSHGQVAQLIGRSMEAVKTNRKRFLGVSDGQ